MVLTNLNPKLISNQKFSKKSTKFHWNRESYIDFFKKYKENYVCEFFNIAKLPGYHEKITKKNLDLISQKPFSNYKLGGIHKLRKQDFANFWPPPLR